MITCPFYTDIRNLHYFANSDTETLDYYKDYFVKIVIDADPQLTFDFIKLLKEILTKRLEYV